MKYMGSKRRIVKHILPIMLEERKENQAWVEPFVGGANVIENVDGLCIGSDVNKYVIALLNHLRCNYKFDPPHVDKFLYQTVKKYKDGFESWFVGYVGFCLSYGAKWFGGYRNDKSGKRDYQDEAIRHLRKQQKKIRCTYFVRSAYLDLEIPPNSVIYCDPPYQGTTKYSTPLVNADQFWQWCRQKSDEGHTVFVSEYSAPPDFKCVWQKTINSSLTQDTGSKKAVEKLFTLRR